MVEQVSTIGIDALDYDSYKFPYLNYIDHADDDLIGDAKVTTTGYHFCDEPVRSFHLQEDGQGRSCSGAKSPHASSCLDQRLRGMMVGGSGEGRAMVGRRPMPPRSLRCACRRFHLQQAAKTDFEWRRWFR